MDYQSHYNRLIGRARMRSLSGYGEKHHILPRCMGGDDSDGNLVTLTAREHFIAHLLLVKIYGNDFRLIKAAAMMCMGQDQRKMNNKLYGKFRELWRAAMSDSQTGQGNSQWGTKWIYSDTLKLSRKIPKEQDIPNGWNLGRIVNFDKKPRPLPTKDKRRDIIREKNTALARNLYNSYVNGNFVSIRDFCRLGNYTKSHVSLTKMWKKFIPEFADNVKPGKRFIPK